MVIVDYSLFLVVPSLKCNPPSKWVIGVLPSLNFILDGVQILMALSAIKFPFFDAFIISV
jgi:hypothetical protein